MRRLSTAVTTAVALAILAQGQAWARSSTPVYHTIVIPAATPPAPPLVDDGKPGSAYMQCDGRPRVRSSAELIADVGLITITGGLFGLIDKVEQPDARKRLAGRAGIAACNAVLATDTIPLRRAQLTLARSILDIEAKDYDAAIADARASTAAAGEMGAQADFQHSVGLSALKLEAVALVGLHRPAEAEAVALRMAAMAPYDLLVLLDAQDLVPLTTRMTPEKSAYLAQFSRMYGPGLFQQARSREWVNDFAGAAADVGASLERAKGVWPDQPTCFDCLAYRAETLALAGDRVRSTQDAEQARRLLDDRVKSGQGAPDAVARAQELLDFEAIVEQANAGDITTARAAFGSRSRWNAPSAPAVAYLSEKLRAGAQLGPLRGALAVDPQALRDEAIAARSNAWTEAPNVGDLLFKRLWGFIPEKSFTALAATTWKIEGSRHLLKLSDKDKKTFQGEIVSFVGAPLAPASQALLLHCALIAKSRGKSGFVLVPVRTRLDVAGVRFGDIGEPGFPTEATFDAEKVITDLSPKFPKP
jgi:hypothetical protein